MFISLIRIHNHCTSLFFKKTLGDSNQVSKQKHKEVKMTIKKLTVAAAIAVGIATCSINNAMAACPLSGCSTPCAPACATPCVTPCATPCATPCVTPCAPACATPCATACPAPCDTSSPACATCPGTSSCKDLDMKQVYGYPNAIYGTNNYTGEQSNAIYSTETAWCLDQCDTLGMGTAGLGVAGLGQMTGAACGYSGCGSCDGGAMVNRATGCGCKSSAMPIITGAACGCGSLPVITGAACGCNSGCGCDGGSVVNRCGCNSACPVTIQTCNSIDALKKAFIPFTPSVAVVPPCGCASGAAAGLINAFPDVPENYWAACPIDRLALNNVVVGYPDRYFRPGIDVSRAEFATMMVKGYNLNCDGLTTSSLFKDVPCDHWANPLITKAVQEGIMCGHPNGLFKPKLPVSRAEALTAMAHGINCDMDACKAKEILSQYCDGTSVPSWAEIPIAKALNSGVLKNSPNPNQIAACDNASRAEIADMLQTVRVAAGFDTNPTTACDCPKVDPCAPACPSTAYMEQTESVKIPTLKLCFRDEINAKSSNVGDQFAANTSEEVTINGQCYPKGSRVNGKIVEVVRPSSCTKGALKLAFTNIENCSGCKCNLPKQILTAQIDCARTQNIVSRLVATPFTWVGGLVGVTGRTIGGMIASAGNAAEAVSGGVGIAAGEILQGPCVWPAAGRSLQDAAKAAIIAPVDFTRTALSGTIGLFQSTADEVAYLVAPDGSKISAINPKEKVTIAFGCSGQ